MRDLNRRMFLLFACAFYGIVLYFSIKAAPHLNEGGVVALINGLYFEMQRPLTFSIGVWTLKSIAIMTLIYLAICLVIYDSIKNYRWDEEYGSSKWGDVNALLKQYKTPKKEPVFPDIEPWRQDTILTSRMRMGFNFESANHQKNLNTMIVGGSGTWKSRGYILPNLLQGNSSFVVTDPKGELLAKTGWVLEKKYGYKIKVFDIKNPEKSMCYNPFKYFKSDMDVLKFVDNFFNATDDKRASKGDKFWDDQAKNLMLAFCFLLFKEAPEEEQNINMVFELLMKCKIKETAKGGKEDNAIDYLFREIEQKDPYHVAVGYYNSYNSGGAKTLQSIQSTLSSRLSYFSLDEIKKITMTDDIDFKTLATEKIALFCVLPDNNKALNFLIGTLYQQMFQELGDLADNVYHGKLPMHIRFLLDEFANITLPDDYEHILSTARGRNMSFTIVLQDLSQIESLFKDVFESIKSNCDEHLFLGSNSLKTCKEFSEMLGKETVDVKETSRTSGIKGSTSVSKRKVQRDLLFPDELRRKANKIAILYIQGEYPIRDNKYNLKNHRMYKYIAEGRNLKRKKEPVAIYDWGNIDTAIGKIEISNNTNNITDLRNFEVNNIVGCEEDLYKFVS